MDWRHIRRSATSISQRVSLAFSAPPPPPPAEAAGFRTAWWVGVLEWCRSRKELDWNQIKWGQLKNKEWYYDKEVAAVYTRILHLESACCFISWVDVICSTRQQTRIIVGKQQQAWSSRNHQEGQNRCKIMCKIVVQTPHFPTFQPQPPWPVKTI